METLAETVVFPFSERNGVGVVEDVAVLLDTSEHQFAEWEQHHLQSYARGLYDGQLDVGECHTLSCHTEQGATRSVALGEIYRTSVVGNEHTFYLRYFATAAGRADLLAIDPQGDLQTLPDKLLDAAYINARLSTKAQKEIATRGLNWRKADIAERLANDESNDAAYEPEETVSANYQPEKLLQKMADLQTYRRFYREAHRHFKRDEQGDGAAMRHAKQTLISLYAGRVNAMLAELIPHAATLARQLDRCEQTPQTTAWSAQLEAVAPTVLRAFREDTTGREAHARTFFDGYARRLDLLRNGAAWHAGEQNASPISQELLSLADRLSADQTEQTQPPELPAETIALLDATRWQAPKVQSFGEKVLSSWGLLSEHRATWDEIDDRSGWAPDGKWQIVVHPKRKSLSINGAKGVVIVPQDFDRGLLDESPAGALPVIAHELTHVWQTEYDKHLAQQIPLAAIKGRRYMTMREMGGIEQERVIHAKVGRTRNVNLHYLRALQTKQVGGNLLQTARAFYRSAQAGKAEPLTPAADARLRALAADRTLRLYRQDGHNSQPLDYAEQELILAGLSGLSAEQKTAVIIAGGSFSLRDSAVLHRAGLLELPQAVHINPAEDVWRIFTEDELPQLQMA